MLAGAMISRGHSSCDVTDIVHICGIPFIHFSNSSAHTSLMLAGVMISMGLSSCVVIAIVDFVSNLVPSVSTRIQLHNR